MDTALVLRYRNYLKSHIRAGKQGKEVRAASCPPKGCAFRTAPAPWSQGPRGAQVIELPIKHPEIFDSLGISQPKGVREDRWRAPFATWTNSLEERRNL